jgi:uncharacterized membrane protein YhaH (DUF805 family)
MNLSLFTKLDGRIGRQQWWLGLIVLVVAIWIIMFVITMLFGQEMTQGVTDGGMSYQSNISPVGIVLMIIVYIPFLWASICLSGKRWHDRGKSAWWILIGLIPIIGGIWALVENGFLKGTDGPNQYGPDPLAGA